MRFARMIRFAPLVLALAAVVLATPLPAEDEQPQVQEQVQEQEQERPLTLEQLPAAVKATVLKEAGNHAIREIEEVRLGAKLYYEAEWLDGKFEVEIQVAPDGTLLGRETEEPDDEEDDDEVEDQGDDD